jgi:RimJ/RimL family protein N-acetyltransferase
MSHVTRLFRFRPMQPADLDLVYEWVNEPHVSAWRSGFEDRGQFELFFMDLMESDWQFPNIALLGSKPAGFLLYYVAGMKAEELGLSDSKGVLGIEFFLGAREYLNKGLGDALVERAAELLFRQPAIAALVAAVANDNVHARHVLEKAGFRPLPSAGEKTLLRLDQPDR